MARPLPGPRLAVRRLRAPQAWEPVRRPAKEDSVVQGLPRLRFRPRRFLAVRGPAVFRALDLPAQE